MLVGNAVRFVCTLPLHHVGELLMVAYDDRVFGACKSQAPAATLIWEASSMRTLSYLKHGPREVVIECVVLNTTGYSFANATDLLQRPLNSNVLRSRFAE